jgi:hypothetical protein
MRALLGASVSDKKKSLDDHILFSNLMEQQQPPVSISDFSFSKGSRDVGLSKSVTWGQQDFGKTHQSTLQQDNPEPFDRIQTIMHYHKNYGGLKVSFFSLLFSWLIFIFRRSVPPE